MVGHRWLSVSLNDCVKTKSAERVSVNTAYESKRKKSASIPAFVTCVQAFGHFLSRPFFFFFFFKATLLSFNSPQFFLFFFFWQICEAGHKPLLFFTFYQTPVMLLVIWPKDTNQQSNFFTAYATFFNGPNKPKAHSF